MQNFVKFFSLEFSTQLKGLKLPKFIQYLISGLFVIITIIFTWLLTPNIMGNDWIYAFRPAVNLLLDGKDPYTVNQFLIAPWIFILFIPLSWFSDALALAILRILGLIGYAYAANKLRAKPLGIFFILLSPQVLHNLINGNIDWLAILGFVLPPQIGVFFLSIKPQIGLALIIYYAVDAIKRKVLLRTFGPFIFVVLISFALFGLWPLSFTTVQAAYNASLWPFSMPFGIVLLLVSLRQQNVRIAQGISPLFSPHVMFHSWVTMIFALAPNTLELITSVVASWLLILIIALA